MTDEQRDLLENWREKLTDIMLNNPGEDVKQTRNERVDGLIEKLLEAKRVEGWERMDKSFKILKGGLCDD